MVASADPRTLYGHPPDLVAATSLGEANVVPAWIHGGQASCALGRLAVRAEGQADVEGPGWVLLRPEQLALCPPGAPGSIGATVAEVQYHGHDALAYVRLDQPDVVPPDTLLGRDSLPAPDTLLARVAGDAAFAPGQQVSLEVRGPVQAWPRPVTGTDDQRPAEAMDTIG